MEIVYYAPQKFFEKYKIFFVPNPKIPHIKNVGPLLSIFGFYPIQKQDFWGFTLLLYHLSAAEVLHIY